jgi:hypothetical protein
MTMLANYIDRAMELAVYEIIAGKFQVYREYGHVIRL